MRTLGEQILGTLSDAAPSVTVSGSVAIIESGDSAAGAGVLVSVNPPEILERDIYAGLKYAPEFKTQLSNLLPPGQAWDHDLGTIRDNLIEAWAQEFARIQARINDLVDAADPQITYELLTDYERIFGLPTDCMAGIVQSLDRRHFALISQMVSVGGQSRAYFIAIAAAAGFNITITELFPFTVAMRVDVPVSGPDWSFAWEVNAASVTVSSFHVTSGVNEALATWGNTLLECLINRFKPAHTTVIFSYA